MADMHVTGKGKMTLEGKVIRGDGKGGVLEVEDLGVMASSDGDDEADRLALAVAIAEAEEG